MKRWTVSLLALCLALSLAACGGDAAPRQSQGVDADVDLTQLSSTLVYAEVYNMASNPQSYVGKTVRMKGNLELLKGEYTMERVLELTRLTGLYADGGFRRLIAERKTEHRD